LERRFEELLKQLYGMHVTMDHTGTAMFLLHWWQQVVFLWKRGIGNMFSSCFLRKHQRNCIQAYQNRKAQGLFPKETLAKCVYLMLFPWETGLGTSSAYVSTCNCHWGKWLYPYLNTP
jgi:hypothetical protein